MAEYGREYTSVKLERGDAEWRSAEFVHIARNQNWRENAAARRANRLLIADTNAFATTLWHRRYMGCESAETVAEAAEGRCDLYLLTGDEIPFEPDGIRDGEAIRHRMHEWFVEALHRQPVPWIELRGSHEARLAAAVPAIDARQARLASLADRIPGGARTA